MHLSDYSDMYQNIGSALMGFTCRKVDTGSLYQLLQVTYRIGTLFLQTGFQQNMIIKCCCKPSLFSVPPPASMREWLLILVFRDAAFSRLVISWNRWHLRFPGDEHPCELYPSDNLPQLWRNMSFMPSPAWQRTKRKQLPYALVVGTVYCDTCFHQELSKPTHFIS
ncbi:hypothetical protein MUK42_01566, partial [Musa troglodytarum]